MYVAVASDDRAGLGTRPRLNKKWRDRYQRQDTEADHKVALEATELGREGAREQERERERGQD